MHRSFCLEGAKIPKDPGVVSLNPAVRLRNCTRKLDVSNVVSLPQPSTKCSQRLIKVATPNRCAAGCAAIPLRFSRTCQKVATAAIGAVLSMSPSPNPRSVGEASPAYGPWAAPGPGSMVEPLARARRKVPTGDWLVDAILSLPSPGEPSSSGMSTLA